MAKNYKKNKDKIGGKNAKEFIAKKLRKTRKKMQEKWCTKKQKSHE